MLIELIAAAAADDPDRPAVIAPDQTTSYGALLARAEALARGLDTRSVTRFAVRLDDVVDTIAVLAAASAVGAEPCLYAARLADDEVDDLGRRLGHEVIVTDSAHPATMRPLAPDDIAVAVGPLPSVPESAPVLILTTGTTGAPKGARHDWRRLAAGAGRARTGSAGARWLLAYNLHQFAGIQIMLRVLLDGSTLVVPSSNQPVPAVDALREHGVTHASATPTFWRVVVGIVDDDTAQQLALRQITLGGEAVPEHLLTHLARLFPAARISQVYASTEFGSSVSVRDGRHGLPLSVLERGEDAEVQFRIVDGQLHARSRVGMLGYIGEDPAAGAGDWRPTGDLVEIDGDRIVFVGRTTEVINVGGVKVHPLPIEETIGAVDGVQLVHAYAEPNAIAGQVVAVDIVADEAEDQGELRRRIRASCVDLPDAARPRLIRFVPEIELRGNKIDRRVAP